MIGSGALAGFEFGRQGRYAAAFAFSFLLSGVASLAAWLLTRRVRTAERAALRDPLTGLPNRTLLDDRIEQALARARRTGEPFALMVVDLDGFKSVNDVWGHEAGNAVLRSIARRLQAVVRETDTVARVGGDEFVIVSLGTQEDAEAAALVSRMRQSLRRPYRVRGTPVELDASVGWALFPQDALSPGELLARADGEMYATKRDTSDESALDRRVLDAGAVRDVELALAHSEIVVHYQPIVDLRSGEVRAVEALVRRAHENRLASPSEFIPYVEGSPVVRSLTLAVAADALRHLAEWDVRGHRLEAAVNIPYRLLDDEELVSGLRRLLEAVHVDPARLTLEIVPSGPGAGAAIDEKQVDRLRRLGVRLSLDDLGRASSIAAIRTLPLDQAKIDAMFLHHVGRDHRSSAIVHSLVELSHRLGLEVVAEGIETRLAWDTAARLGCDRGQGFFLGHPLPPHELVEWLERQWPVVTVV
ncbi:MAG TPA: EAL domain-containing protein [Gaiella sp.]|nr:EAL domain-containing protein [Gaiella sp.]